MLNSPKTIIAALCFAGVMIVSAYQIVISPSLFSITNLGWLAVICACLYVFFNIYRNTKAYKKEQKAPVLSSSAKLIDKNAFTVSAGETSFNNVPPDYVLIFELADRSRKSFHVTQDIYVSILEDEEGTLQYKEVPGMQPRFIEFQRM